MSLFNISFAELKRELLFENIKKSINIIINEKTNESEEENGEYNNYLINYFFIIKLFNLLKINNNQINEEMKKELRQNKNYQKLILYLEDNIDKITNSFKNVLNKKNYLYYETNVQFYEENININII